MHTTFFLIGFFAFLLAMIVFDSVMSRRHRGDGDGFLLGGRGVPVFLTIGTTVATMVGTGSSMGAVGFGYNNGWGGALYGIGGAIGILLLAWWFAPMRRLRFMTMSEELSYYVGGSRLVRNVVAMLIYVATPSYRQRIYSAQSVSSVRYSFLFTGVLYLAFSIIPAIVGMAAHTLAPDLENSNYAFPYLATQVLPMGLGMLMLIAGLSATMSSASSDALAGVAIMMRDLWVMATGHVPALEKVVLFSRFALIVTIGLALAFALITDNVITYITTMIATVMSGLFVCGMLGRFWDRYNWQGAIATLVAASITSLIVSSSAAMKAFCGNPSIPAVVVAVLAGVTVTLMTPRSRVTRQQALNILNEERAWRCRLPDPEKDGS